MKLFRVLSLTLAVMFSSQSFAGVISFEGENEGTEELFWYEQDGVELLVSAWVTNVNSDQDVIMPWQYVYGEEDGRQLGVYNGSTGLGVRSSASDGSDLDGGSSGNWGDLDEGILLHFSQDVELISVSGNDLSDNDDINVSIFDVWTFESDDLFIDRQGQQDDYDTFSVGAIGQAFMIWVDGNDDDIRLADIEFRAVPEPTSLFLLAGMLLVTVFAARRQR